MAIEKKQLLKDMGERYFAVRKAKNYTQEDAADIAEVTQQAISDAELGKSFLAPDCMLRLCIAYGISVDYLLTGEVSDKDRMILDKRVQKLDSDDYFHYQAVSEHFLAVALKNKSTKA